MPASQWTGPYSHNFYKSSSYADDEEEHNGDESIRSDDEDGFERRAGDDISALASQVLADFEAFFDHELCEGEGDVECASDHENEDGGSKQNERRSSAAAISLEELSVVLNASIQRHQAPVNAGLKASRASSGREKPRMSDKAKARSNGQHHELPFAHFQLLLEQKTQLFREKCYESRRKLARFARQKNFGKQQPKRQQQQQKQQRKDSGSWNLGSRSGGSSLSSFDDEEEGYSSDDDDDDVDSEEQSNEDEESVVSVASSVAPSDDNCEKKTAAQGRRTVSLSLPAKRGALTQATLMQDQGQQTSIPKVQVASEMRFSMHPSRSESLKSQKEHHEDEEFKRESGTSGEGDEEEPSDDRVLQSKWSLSLQSLNSNVMGSAKASANSNCAASSSSSVRSYCSSDDIERLTRIYRNQSENSRAVGNANLRREVHAFSPKIANEVVLIEQTD